MAQVQLTLNGTVVRREVEPRTLLIDLLRDGLGLTGTHNGCDTSQCGCCTVILDGKPVKSCTTLAVQADGGAVTTIEGLAAADGTLHPVQEAFVACHGLQCGFCTPGMVMSSVSLLSEHPNPSDDEIREALEGNLCRCTCYVNIVAAVRQAASVLANKR